MRHHFLFVALVVLGVGVMPDAAAPREFPPPQGPPRAAASTDARPVYVLLTGSFVDHVNYALTDERFRHTLELVDRFRRQYPASNMSCVFQFSGTTADRVVGTPGERNWKQVMAPLGSAIEIGYEGRDEPTFAMRPRPNFREARTPADRFAARAAPLRWFLTEYKDRLLGTADPARSGGLKAVQEVFGEAVLVTGANLEVGGDPEFVHVLNDMNLNAVLPGVSDSSDWPARTVFGYGDSALNLSRALAPDADCPPEMFWMNSRLRLSSMGQVASTVLAAHEGPAALSKLLESLDRTRPHVIQVQVGHHDVHARRVQAAGHVQTPLEFAYDSPKRPSLPEALLQPEAEVKAAYAREEAALRWLCEDFFPKNAGSRFVSVAWLRQAAERGARRPLSMSDVQDAARIVAESARQAPIALPDFVSLGGIYYSLTEVFSLFATALAGIDAGTPPPRVLTPMNLYGPLDVEDRLQEPDVRVSAGAITQAAATMLTSWKSGKGRSQGIPPNLVPSGVSTGDATLNAGQFLKAMADVLLDPRPERILTVPRSRMIAPLGELYPRTRPPADQGATWTLKPVRLLP